jgi:hypothetical protein
MLIHCVPDAIAERTELTPEIESALQAWVAEMKQKGLVPPSDFANTWANAETERKRLRGELLPLLCAVSAGYDVIDRVTATRRSQSRRRTRPHGWARREAPFAAPQARPFMCNRPLDEQKRDFVHQAQFHRREVIGQSRTIR